MARGAEGKSRRKAEKKEERERVKEEEKKRLLAEGNENDFDAPADGMPPFPTPMTKQTYENDNSKDDENDDDSDDDDSDDEEDEPKSKKSSRSTSAMPPKKKEGIKTLPLVMLLILTGTTVLPALLFAGDWFGSFLQRNHVLGSIGHRLGIGPSPKKRVLSFYEKHDPEKITEVPNILAKYYGDYPKLVKRLERKYNDYGYFLNWENDEAPMTLAFDMLDDTRRYFLSQWNAMAPQFLKNAARNIQFNLTTLYKKGRKMFKKYVWPVLEPIVGVPEGSAAQKRKDARQARTASGERVKRAPQFRDDET